ncbi:MAG TPA: enoyl-CoA hydratase-related protein [Pseudomonadales bacterium]|jgi:enoyl-CoA hydratase/carnithine racemase|nr:enoyl-CoA hydratase-related protein [Pseudomonadales bacterium]MDP6314888.1 enoyl-CoA hydratase-related protein [Pseudomonadales bacterium]MDP7316542.1 enoyl-CoA hydratase-related protein [Pseudomonadales bacterium]MDP7575750.1 enoyl-CoA hydratase-related protein [Pseudomonadales bacterium]HJL60456.1 enoyl-CoA hydratase-related protein [Pseudomonadales bacterium]|tara:strand:+ start:3095 stop:3931 length:837 start_codon:yes stop_codon:yes gene_type:complete
MTDYAEILYEIDGPVATITINRPDTLNALTDLTQAEIRHALDASEKNSDILGTVLTGAGRGFCSGVDMTALGAMSEAGQRLGKTHEHLAANPGNPDDDPNYKSSPSYFLGLRKPLIAALNGVCAGLGFSYATFCDMRFMDSGARIVSSFSPRGLIAEHGTCWMLPRLVGPSNALDVFWSSRRIEAEEAYRIGWANRLCEPGQSLQDAQDYLRSIAGTAAPMSLMMMKRQVYKHLNRELGDAMNETIVWMDESLARDDFKEGVASFVEKRPPNFQRVDV